MSMLVPLETLPGWPEAPTPTALESLGLLIGIPAVVFAVIALLVNAPKLARAAKGTPVTVTEPLWLGGGSRKNLELTAGAESATDLEVGGASARW